MRRRIISRFSVFYQVNRKSIIINLILPYLLFLLVLSILDAVHFALFIKMDEYVSNRTLLVCSESRTCSSWQTDPKIAFVELLGAENEMTVYKVILYHVRDVQDFTEAYDDSIEMIPFESGDIEQIADFRDLKMFEHVLSGFRLLFLLLGCIFTGIMTLREIDTESWNNAFFRLLGFSFRQRLFFHFMILLRILLYGTAYTTLVSILLSVMDISAVPIWYSFALLSCPVIILYPIGAFCRKKFSP